jgi:hypothetical protein
MPRPDTSRITKSLRPDALDELIITGYSAVSIHGIHREEAEQQGSTPFKIRSIQRLVIGRKILMAKKEREKYGLPDRAEIIAILERGNMKEMVELLVRNILEQTWDEVADEFPTR